MLEMLLPIVILLLLIIVLLQILLLKRKANADFSPLFPRFEILEKNQERAERMLREELAKNREEGTASARAIREEMAAMLNRIGDSAHTQMTNVAGLQKNQLDVFSERLERLTDSNEKRLADMRGALDTRLRQIQEDNGKQLDQMRATVEEKLQGTLERRLGESFRQVSERLEQVHKGLGEMQSLATGVGDLKRVLTNVKTRGSWGEIQLGALLEQILTPEQYERNVRTKENSSEVVEFAIKLPGAVIMKMKSCGCRLTPNFRWKIISV